MTESFRKTHGWPGKIRNALRGMLVGIRSESSFHVHMPMAAAVIVLATVLKLDVSRWCLLIICITIVLSGELLNTSIERLARALDIGEDSHLRDALDIASGAVLTLAIGAAVTGTVVLAPPLLSLIIAG